MTYDAELHNVRCFTDTAYGHIFNDSKKRFVDGTPVSTSRVLYVIREVKTRAIFIKTRNTTYKVVGSFEDFTK